MLSILLVLIKLLLIDLIFVGILFVLISVLSRTKRAAFAVMRRNFFGYFSNPTGYVFLCIFVFLTSLAAFWPYEFFNDNLATLDQLNQYLPLIMLFFIPAITMSIWAEEKRQGTDELLLTLPADDFDIVIGKYLAASAIFTASLLFSQLSTFVTLAVLSRGDMDTGLFFTTYLGYWFVGLSMIAIGMVASFLTGNLTVGFILGALFNAPLAFASMADAILPAGWPQRVVSASGLSAQFDDFGRGVISSASTVYFLLVGIIGIYMCMVLIGRRHWTGSKDGNTMFWHYMARTLALIVLAGGAVVLLRTRDVLRVDTTEGKVSSLSPATQELIRNLDADRPIVVDAFISTDIPEQYARTRYELTNLLKEFRAEAAKCGKTLEVNLQQDLELFSDEAAMAEERFGIQPASRFVRAQGSMQNQQILLGAAFRCGLEKVVVPFFDYGIPVEYELVRSIKTVSQATRKKLGIIASDAQLMGGFSMAGGTPRRIEKHPLVIELEKQYQVDSVDLSSPLDPERFDAILAVQPSSLTPDRFDRLIEGIKKGIPTAIFEDPVSMRGIPGTGAAKQAGAMFGQRGGPIPKGDIRKLWDVLDIESPGTPSISGSFSPDIVWQHYNPYPKMRSLGVDDQWIFAKEEAPGADDALSESNPISSGLREVLFIYAGSVLAKKDSPLKHTPIVQTGMAAGTISHADVQKVMQAEHSLREKQGGFKGAQTIAMTIESPGTEADAAAAGVRAVYVADTDLMIEEFLAIRAQPELFAEVDLRIQNVTFVLNIMDWLGGEDLFIDVRKHEPRFSTLQLIEEVENIAREKESEASVQFNSAFNETVREIEEKNGEEMKKLQKELDDAKEKSEDGKIGLGEYQAIQTRFLLKQQQLERMLSVRREKLERERDHNIATERRTADLTVRKMQNQVKATAVTLPCIPPLIIGVIVFSSRRLRERDNIVKSRLV